MSAGWVGKESRTIIPATATAEIDMRLVKESDYMYLARTPPVTHRGSWLSRYRSRTLRMRSGSSTRTSFPSPMTSATRRIDPIWTRAAGRLARAGMRHLYGEEPILDPYIRRFSANFTVCRNTGCACRQGTHREYRQQPAQSRMKISDLVILSRESPF